MTGIWDESLIEFFGLPFSYPVYRPLIDKLDQIAHTLGAKLVIFPYDWRVNFWKSDASFTSSSDVLAKAIEAEVAGGASSVTLVCHSMGSLVARLVLESAKYQTTDWIEKVHRLICICGPHLGAPKALGRALACEGNALGLDASEWRAIANDPRYPAGFQLFPVRGHATLYDVSSGSAVPVDVYDPTEGAKYGFTQSNSEAALESWGRLDVDRHPKTVQYFLIAGTGFPDTTSSAYLFDGTRHVETICLEGDGTVPLWSALTGKYVQTYSMPGEHVRILGTLQLSQTLDQIFGLPIMSAFVKEAPAVTINVNKDTFAPNETMQVLVLPDTPANELDGKLTLSLISTSSGKRRGESPGLVPYGVGATLQYKGPETSHLSTRLVAPRIPGAYVLKFEGVTHRSTDASSAVFFVNAVSKVSIHPREPTAAKEKRPVVRKRAGRKKRKK